MKNKGYTLIELLGVMIILAALITLVFPSLINFIKKSTNETNELTSKLSYAAAEMYIKDTNEFNTIYGNKYCISLNTLVENDYLKGKQNYNGKDVTNKMSVQVSYNGKFNYELVENNSCEGMDIFLPSNLTPVTYDGDNWIVADPTKKWYDYSNQEWANAVILRSDVTKKVGDTISVDGENPDALAMLVWIPRYEYKIEGEFGKGGTSADSPGEIEVNFISTNKLEASEGYIIHPAFNFGGTEVSGMWVGKFEISHTTLSSSTTDDNLNCINEECESSQGLRVLPNVSSLRYNNVSNFFFGIRSMSKEGNIFGIDKEITDTHMIKNNEWGAVAYLSQSKYGKYGNSTYTAKDKEVYINNSNSYYTGRSGGSYGGNTAINTVYTAQTSTSQYNRYGFYTYDGYLLEYNTNTKANPQTRKMDSLASTTGNIYGVYDMSGGAYEYTMGVFANSEGKLYSGYSLDQNSGFFGLGFNSYPDPKNHIEIPGVEWPDEKYYNVYKASSGTTMTQTTACNGVLCHGHALNETKNWYGDTGRFVSASVPWFGRGGDFNGGGSAGVFSSNHTYGHSFSDYSARLCLFRTT